MTTYSKRKYSLIFCYETFFHVPSHLGYLTMINFNKSLKKEGLAIIQFAIEDKSLRKQFFEIIFSIVFDINKIFNFFGKGFNVTVTRYTEEEIKDIIYRTGFVIDKRLNNLFLLKKVKEIN